MRIALSPNAFKGSLTALEAAECMRKGFHAALPRASFILIPMADGGDGTLQAVVDATGGRLLRKRVHDPLGRFVAARFGLSGDGGTAIIEMAEASGLVLLKSRERNPLLTSTRGTGELICKALDLGVRKIVIGIGGSATNDGGTGMARALGVRFLDASGKDLPEGGGSLVRLERIDMSRRDHRLQGVALDIACDVNNPLVGPHGATRVYAPQKGATPAMVKTLEAGLVRLGRVIRSDIGLDVAKVPGAGAAGGMGAGLMAFAGGRLKPGVEIVADVVRLRERLRGCDLVVTGEGRMDGQTVHGKTPVGVARVAQALGIPVIAIVGSLGMGARAVLDHGIDAYFSVLQRPMSEAQIRRHGPAMLTACSKKVGLFLCGR